MQLEQAAPGHVGRSLLGDLRLYRRQTTAEVVYFRGALHSVKAPYIKGNLLTFLLFEYSQITWGNSPSYFIYLHCPSILWEKERFQQKTLKFCSFPWTCWVPLYFLGPYLYYPHHKMLGRLSKTMVMNMHWISHFLH